MNRKNMFYTALSALTTGLILFTAVSCKDDDEPTPAADNTHVNNWIYENMKYFYLWTDDLPASPDKKLAPDAFFESLLSNQDRFSWIQENYQDLLNSLQGINKEAGFEFTLYRESSGSENVIEQIMYVKPDSPAETAGLKRGDVITHINGNRITTANYQKLLSEDVQKNYSITYTPYIAGTEQFEAAKTISLTVVEYHEDPLFLDTVYTLENHTIGYLIYNFFTPGTENDAKKYDNEVDAAFANFKSKGITDLVIDFRYNGGGSETSSTNLASLIGTGVDATKTFARREYNDAVTQDILNDPDLGAAFMTTRFLNKSQNIGSQLNGNRVYILTSDHTASASELVINGLKPYMDVVLIGDVTYGKNVGSISIYDEDDKDNTWGMQPIIVKVYNSLNQSDYSNGFEPNIENLDNSLYLYPLGDLRETMLSDAVNEITGGSGRVAQTTKGKRAVVAESMDFKKGKNALIVSDKPFKRN